ncbi:MAG: hypothetical protein A2900_00070 [Candidatus Chisholmbacteria bacterium RIFCSPLOWO2_01_FULL_50_28]|nr:MAG: hypothetical protein A2900_00070 [Candidatus Chisholmbacteria bacterium RIFCSPLOWO2_01_FULL_50_28]
MRKLISEHVRVLVVYLIVFMLLRWEWPGSVRGMFDLVGLWVGGAIGMALLGLDRVIHVYATRPHEQLSQQVSSLVGQRKLREALQTLLLRRGEQYHLAFRNGVFALVFIPVLFFAITSTSGLFGKGIALGLMVHLVYDIWRDQLTRPQHLNSWLFWMVSREVSPEEQRTFVWILTGGFGLLNLLLL